MRLSKLDQFLETVDYSHGGESLSITFDSNAFSADFFRSLADGMRKRLVEIEKGDRESKKKQKAAKGINRTLLAIDEEARSIEIERDIYAELLSVDKGYVIKEWSALDDEDNPLEPTYENLRSLSPLTLKTIFKFLRNYKRPNESTSVTTADGLSPEAPIQAQESQTM